MSELCPFRVLPDFKERVWGSRDLSPIYTEIPGEKPIGEAWLTGDDNRVAEGPLAGATLRELCQRYGRDLVGAAPQTDRFPLLIKFLFPRDKLSVQVHPDDRAAHIAGEPCGKTECWYVAQAEAGAQIGLGLKPGTTREQFARAIQETKAEELLNWINVHPGEMYYVEAGTVHAIGPGSILLETQQNSDTTYRLYDYGRPRELHIERGLRVMKERTTAGRVEPVLDPDGRMDGLIVSSSSFRVSRWRLRNSGSPVCDSGYSENEDSRSWPTVEIVVGINGDGIVAGEGFSPVRFGRGEAVVVPAAVDRFEIQPQGDLEALSVFLPPPDRVPEPES
jgi:mannose-6-phosphate isomerase